MRLPKVPRAALDVSLRLTRIPADALIDLIPDAGARPRAAAQRIVDHIDSHARSLLGLASEDREMRQPPSDPSPPGRRPPARPARRPPAPPASRPPAPPAPRPPEPPVVGAPTPNPPAPPPSPPAPAARRPPSHEEIAARAFELYEQGVPGNAETHWQAAERELSAAHDA